MNYTDILTTITFDNLTKWSKSQRGQEMIKYAGYDSLNLPQSESEISNAYVKECLTYTYNETVFLNALDNTMECIKNTLTANGIYQCEFANEYKSCGYSFTLIKTDNYVHMIYTVQNVKTVYKCVHNIDTWIRLMYDACNNNVDSFCELFNLHHEKQTISTVLEQNKQTSLQMILCNVAH